MEVENPYEVRLEIFEGPMDLLIHLIRKNEVDIFDIPISKITDQYLSYIEMMKSLNINLAGEFFVMAATLMHIKSRMLIPSDESEDEEDPRQEIVRPLIEYMKIKEVSVELLKREILERDVFHRPLYEPDEYSEYQKEPVVEASLFQLIDAFQKIIEEKRISKGISIQIHRWSLNERIEEVLEELKRKERLRFKELFKKDMGLSFIIVTFLAILELINRHKIKAYQRDPDSDIEIYYSR